MMGTRMPILQRLPAALSSVLLEWILMLLLFIDAVYCFLVTRFARLCKLPAPCPFCSRLDHVLGNEKPCFYRELICKTHKSEISSLAFCRLHQKLAGAQSMCEICSSSLAAEEKPNNDDNTDEPLVNVNLVDSDQGKDAALHSPQKRICSCCAHHFKRRSITLFSRKIAELEPAEAAVSAKVFTDYSMSCKVDGSLGPKDIYHQSDHTSHERCSVLQMTPDSEAEVPCADDGGSLHPHEANDMEKDWQEDAAAERPILPFPEVVKAYEKDVQKELNVTDSRDISSACPVVDGHPDSVIGGGQTEAKDISSGGQTSQHDPLVIEVSVLKDADVSQTPVASGGELPQVLGEIEACQRTSEITVDPYTSQFIKLEQHCAVSGDRNIKDNLEEAYGSEITATSSGEFHQRSALTNDPGTTEPAPQDTQHVSSEDTDMKDNFGDIHVSQVSGNSETVGEIEDYPKKTKPTGDAGIQELTSKETFYTASKDLVAEDYVEEAHISQVPIGSSGELSQGLGAIEEHPQTSENIGERSPSLSTQISMNEAYKLAIGSMSSLPSSTLTDVILGKDTSSSVNEELRLLLSQLSASRGLEAPWVDPGPSPRTYGCGDDLIVQNITKRISIERNVSGLESLDGSIVSEMEGESTIDRLRRQIDLDRKSIHLLCKELEEERNASAIAASQALAMITRLQDEKAAMQMEASHYQRMMEEQAEYDSEALAKANELLSQKEQQIEELEAELENYRVQFGGGGPIEKQANQVPFKEENTTMTLVSFEDERAYIANCLRMLEQKLHFYSNNSTSIDLSNSDAMEDDLSDKMPDVKDDTLQRQESSREPREPIFLAKETQSSTMRGEVDLSTLQEEISNLNKRLKTLEGDRNFLEHSINSLRNGKEGVMFMREIASNLRELRAIAIDNE